MTKQYNQKAKILVLYELLKAETDEKARLTTNQIISRLKEKGITVDRKTVYDDIKCLNENGFEVLIERKKHNEYYVVDRPFNLAELRILQDAIQSARFITDAQTNILIEKLSYLASKREGLLLTESVVVNNINKHDNEYIFCNTDIIHNCIINKQKVSFLYFDYDIDGNKKFRKDKKRYIVNPIELVLDQEDYHLICCLDDEYEDIVNFRVDKMTEVIAEVDSSIDAECIATLDLSEYKKEVFGMFGGEYRTLRIVAENSLSNIIIDKFEKNVHLIKKDDNSFEVEVEVQLNPTFFSWCFTYGDKLKVTQPENVVLIIKERLNQLRNCYN